MRLPEERVKFIGGDTFDLSGNEVKTTLETSVKDKNIIEKYGKM
jgi:hypothetical protein